MPSRTVAADTGRRPAPTERRGIDLTLPFSVAMADLKQNFLVRNDRTLVAELAQIDKLMRGLSAFVTRTLTTFGQLSDTLWTELTPAEIEGIQQHLETCAVCAAEYHFEEQLLATVKAKVRRIAAPPDLLAKVARSLRHEEA